MTTNARMDAARMPALRLRTKICIPQRPSERSRAALSCRIAMIAALLSPLSSFSAQQVDPADYRLDITHTVVSQSERGGRTGLKLQLTLRNDSSHDLYDLHLFLSRTGFPQMTGECAPARLQSLKSRDQDEVTWTYSCLVNPLHGGDLREVRLRVEAVDTATGEIVSFASTSTEAR